jgi:hypothetical protein
VRTTRRDLLAAILTALVVLTYVASHEGWGVTLVGDSRRYAAGAILLLGADACGQGSRVAGRSALLFGAFGGAAAVLAVVALWTASPTALALLALDVVLLWIASTLRHAWPSLGRPLPH